MQEDKVEAEVMLDAKHDTSTQLFLHLIEALRPLIDDTDHEPLNWDHVVDTAENEVADFFYLRDVVPQAIHELSNACRHDDWNTEWECNAQAVFCKHLMIQLRLRTTALADFVAKLTHPDDDMYGFLANQVRQLRHLTNLIEKANDLNWFDDITLPSVEIPLTTPGSPRVRRVGYLPVGG